MASSDGKLVFPVYFDLESAVQKASGDADKVLKRLETTIASRPLKLGIEIDASQNGSINAIRKGMAKLVERWNKLSEAQRIANRQSGQYTAEAQNIIDRYAKLVAASESYAKSLEQISSAARKSADEEIKANQKKIEAKEKAHAKAQETIAMLKAEETSIAAVAAKMKFWQDVANRVGLNTPQYKNATAEIERLGAQYERLKSIMANSTGNKGKDIVGIENIKRTLRASETSIDNVKAKLKALNQILSSTPQDSYGFRRAAEQASRLQGVLARLEANKKESTKTEAQLKAEREAAARAELENQRKIKAARARTNADIERERSARQSLIAQKRQEIAMLQHEPKTISEINAQLAIRQRLMAQKETGSAEWKKQADAIMVLQQKLTVMNATQQAHMQALVRESATVRELIKSLRDYGDTLGQLQTRLSSYQSMLNNTKVGGNAFFELSMQIRKVNEELERGRQLAADYQNKAFMGLGDAKTKQKVAEVTQIRDRIAELDRQMNSLNQRGLGTDKNGNLTAEMVNKLNQRIALEKELNNILTTGAEAAKRKLEEEAAAQQKLIEASARRAEEYNRKRQQEAEDLAAQRVKAAEEKRILDEQTAARKKAYADNKTRFNDPKSYNDYLWKIQQLEAKLNKTDAGSKKWYDLTKAIAKAREELKIVADEMNRTAKASERMARLREILAMSERSMAGLGARLSEYNAQLQKQDAGSAAFERTALKIARLNEALQRATQYAQDFAQKAFQGLSGGDTTKRVQELQMWRNQLQDIDERYNRLRNYTMQNGSNASIDKQMNALLDQRLQIVKKIGEATKTAEQQALEREKGINRIIESRKAKQKAHNDAVKLAVQKRKEERTMLMASERTVENITKKLQHWQNKLNTTDMRSGQFQQIAKEVERLTRKLDEAKKKIAELTGQSTSGASKQASNARQVNQEYSKQYSYLDRLVRRMVVYASIGMIGTFLTKVREVTAQFELQRVSLGAILQDQNKANQLFSEIKSFALKSPVSILDLTKYTKQLAAYKIGYDELFETTKKLTDVSVGLGVSMDRVVLAYGQVRATGHLRASEIRQFTEMGVPIVEELAAKLSKLNGETVTAAQVMEMVSKRAISFEMVKDVFDDMTSAGGIFYNMQEKQGNTLYGLWAKLGDAASVMYSEIGNTGVVNSAMKGLISGMTTLMKNWKAVGLQIAVLAAGFRVYKLSQSLATVATIAASKATRDYARAQVQLAAATKAHNDSHILAAQYSMRAAAANRVAAMSTNVWTAAKYRLVAVTNQLKAALIGNWITLAITAFFAIAAAIYSAYEKSTRLQNELSKLRAETGVLQVQSVRDFEYLADAAVKAADGSREQKDALDALRRTYGDMIPEEALRLENLRKMKGNYDELTQAVREYVAAQQESKAINAVNEEEGNVQTSAQKKLREYFIDKDFLGNLALSENEVQRFFVNFAKVSEDNAKTVKDKFIEALRLSGIDGAEEIWKQMKRVTSVGFHWAPGIFGTDDENDRAVSALGQLSESLYRQVTQIKAVREEYRGLTADYGFYTQSMRNYEEWVNKNVSSGETLLQSRQDVNIRILGMESMIRQALRNVGIAWNEEWFLAVRSVNPNDLAEISTLNVDAIVEAVDPGRYPELSRYIGAYRDMYNGLVPPDPVARDVRSKFFGIAQGMKDGGDSMRQYLWDGKKSLKEHVEFLEGTVESMAANLYKWNQYILLYGSTGKADLLLRGVDVDEQTRRMEAVKQILEAEKYYLQQEENKNKRGRKSDTRLQELQEINQTLEKINREYDELAKKEGKSKALDDIRKQFKDTIDYTNKIGKKFGLHFDYPTEFKTLQEYRAEILKVMKSLKNLKGGEKAILDFERLIGNADSDHLQKQIEEQLKQIADSISRTKTASEFYEKILASTGNRSLASKVAESIFGQDGSELKKSLAEQVRGMTNGLDLPEGIISAENIIDYKALREFAEANKTELGGMYDQLVKISEQRQKDLAKTFEGYLKDLEKAKSYSDKRIELARYTANQIAEIQASNLPENEKGRLTAGYKEREDREAAKLEWEAFKDMPIYVQMFADLDNASTLTLTNMRNRLEQMQGAWKNLDPTQLKELQSRLSEINAQLAGRNPFKTLADLIREYREMLASHGSEKALNREIETATDAYLQAKEELAKQLEADPNDKEAVGNLQKCVDLSEEELKQLQKIAEAYKRIKDTIGLSVDNVFQIVHSLSDLAGGIGKVTEVFGGDEEDVQYWNDIASGLDEVTSGIEGMTKAALSGNPLKVATSAVTAIPNMISGFTSLFSAGKIRRANKEIKRQQKILEQLEYTYSRLEHAADSLFGVDYLDNYNQQVKNLQAQQTAYLKQAEAERSKGKKKDKEKIKEYEESARDAGDRLKELQDDLVAHFAGTGRADMARQMAQSWIEARVSMADTFAAIKKDYAGMIKSMLVEGSAARVIENALKPLWDNMQKRLESGDVQGAIDAIVSGMDSALGAANNGMEVLWRALEERGYDMKSLLGDTDGKYSGIAKNISEASSEDINRLAAFVNTALYYISPLPRIDDNVARILAIISNGDTTIAPSAATGWTDWQQQAMDNYMAIQRNTADTVVECRRAANAAEETARRLGKIISAKGGISGVNVFMK